MSDLPGQHEPDWDEQINALLAGELDARALARLETAALDNPALARALEDARQLRQLLGAMPARRAPPGLRRKLRRIPAAGETASGWFWWRRAAFLAGLALVVLVATQRGPEPPGELEIAQGRRDLAIALSYLEHATDKTNFEIRRQIGDAIVDPVTSGAIGTLGQQFPFEQEYPQ